MTIDASGNMSVISRQMTYQLLAFGTIFAPKSAALLTVSLVKFQSMATATKLKIETAATCFHFFFTGLRRRQPIYDQFFTTKISFHALPDEYSGGLFFLLSQTCSRHGSRCKRAFLLLQPIIDLTLKEPRANVDEAMCRLNWQSIGADAEENILMVPVSRPKIKHAHNKTGGKGRKQTLLFSMACTVIIDPLFFFGFVCSASP